MPRRVPTWPQPGRLTVLQRSRREVKDVLRGLGVSEGWTDTFVSSTAHDDVDLTGPAVRVANPLDAEKPFLRRSLLPGLLGALAYNASRRQPDVRLFEVGVVFSHPGAGLVRVVERSGAGGSERLELPGERELLSAVFANKEDDVRSAVAAWHVLADAFRLDRVRLIPPGDGTPPLPGLHPTRSAHLMARAGSLDEVTVGAVGEIDPAVAARFDLTRPAGSGTTARRIGWLEVDLGLLFDEERVPRRITVGGAVSRFPSSDIDLAFVVEDRHPADVVAEALREAGDELLESVHLFDVYRGAGIEEGARSLAYRLRFCADDRTLTDEEVGGLRTRCIEAVTQEFGAPCAEPVARAHGSIRHPLVTALGGCPWHGGHMEAYRVDPSDDELLAEWSNVLRASDEDLWPGQTGFTLPTSVPSPQHRGTYHRFELVAAGEPGGPVLGVGLMELHLRDNLHSAELTVAVHPAHRRRGAGTAIVDAPRRVGRRRTAGVPRTPSSTCRWHGRPTTPRWPSPRTSGSRDAAGEPAAPGRPRRRRTVSTSCAVSCGAPATPRPTAPSPS